MTNRVYHGMIKLMFNSSNQRRYHKWKCEVGQEQDKGGFLMDSFLLPPILINQKMEELRNNTADFSQAMKRDDSVERKRRRNLRFP